jgi:LemA protein
MKKIGCIAAVAIALVIGAVIAWGAGIYNRLVTQSVAVDSAWANVESAYQRRMDLIPNLVETVKGSANFEQTTLQQVVEARARATQIVLTPELLNDPAKFQQFQQSQQALSGALGRLLATVEAYPDLKASQAFLELQSQLESTENRINVERRRFNEAVAAYNTAVRRFPATILAGWFGFDPKAFFESDEGASAAPKVKF